VFMFIEKRGDESHPAFLFQLIDLIEINIVFGLSSQRTF